MKKQLSMEQYLKTLGLDVKSVRCDHVGRLFILIDGMEEIPFDTKITLRGFYKEVEIPEKYQTLENLEIIRKLK